VHTAQSHYRLQVHVAQAAARAGHGQHGAPLPAAPDVKASRGAACPRARPPAPDLIKQALPVLTAGRERGTLGAQAVAEAVGANPRAPVRMVALDVARCPLCGDRAVRRLAHEPTGPPRG
jgi:hypothetical protein